MAPRADHGNAAHLLKRAGWGGAPDEIQRVVDDGIAASVDRLLDPGEAPTVGEPRRRPGVDAFEFDALQSWFVRLAATSPTPAIERLTWFWSGHFSSSIDKVEWPDLLHRQYVTCRRLGLGPFDGLLRGISRDAAMNLMLDLDLSIEGRPNENFARELMELFTLGPDGGYSQRDVVASARAFTGYGLTHHLDRVVGTELRASGHDYGEKSFLGEVGPLDGDDIISIIVERPECARFIARRFWRRYAGTAPPRAVIETMATAFAADHRIDSLLRAMLTSDQFYSSDVRAGLVSQPLETMVRTIRGFELAMIDTEVAEWDREDLDPTGVLPRWLVPDALAEMGQQLGAPPNVAGWPHNDAWLGSNRAAGRLQVGIRLGQWLGDADTDVAEDLRQQAGQADELARNLFQRFSSVDVSADSLNAIAAASRGRPAPQAVAAAFAVAFTSPEVTLA